MISSTSRWWLAWLSHSTEKIASPFSRHTNTILGLTHLTHRKWNLTSLFLMTGINILPLVKKQEFLHGQIEFYERARTCVSFTTTRPLSSSRTTALCTQRLSARSASSTSRNESVSVRTCTGGARQRSETRCTASMETRPRMRISSATTPSSLVCRRQAPIVRNGGWTTSSLPGPRSQYQMGGTACQ